MEGRYGVLQPFDTFSVALIDRQFTFQDFRKIMQITESLRKDGFSPMDSDYRIQSQFVNKQQNSSADQSSSDGNSTGDLSHKQMPEFTSPPPTSHPPPRSTQSKGNIRGNIVDKDCQVRCESLEKKFHLPRQLLPMDVLRVIYLFVFFFCLGGHLRKSQNGNDNVESIDMEMSDEDFEDFPDFADPFEDGKYICGTNCWTRSILLNLQMTPTKKSTKTLTMLVR